MPAATNTAMDQRDPAATQHDAGDVFASLPPFSLELAPSSRVLVLGDGDMSFGRSLAERERAAGRLTKAWPSDAKLAEEQGVQLLVTVYNDKETTWQRHPRAAENHMTIHEHGGRVLYGVDARRLGDSLGERQFDSIVFNFPHPGDTKHMRIERCRAMLLGVFASCAKHLAPDGRIHVQLLKGQGGTVYDISRRQYCDHWQVVELAAEAGLSLVGVARFVPDMFSTYRSAGWRDCDRGFFREGALAHSFGFIPGTAAEQEAICPPEACEVMAHSPYLADTMESLADAIRFSCPAATHLSTTGSFDRLDHYAPGCLGDPCKSEAALLASTLSSTPRPNGASMDGPTVSAWTVVGCTHEENPRAPIEATVDCTRHHLHLSAATVAGGEMQDRLEAATPSALSLLGAVRTALVGLHPRWPQGQLKPNSTSPEGCCRCWELSDHLERTVAQVQYRPTGTPGAEAAPGLVDGLTAWVHLELAAVLRHSLADFRVLYSSAGRGGLVARALDVPRYKHNVSFFLPGRAALPRSATRSSDAAGGETGTAPDGQDAAGSHVWSKELFCELVRRAAGRLATQVWTRWHCIFPTIPSLASRLTYPPCPASRSAWWMCFVTPSREGLATAIASHTRRTDALLPSRMPRRCSDGCGNFSPRQAVNCASWGTNGLVPSAGAWIAAADGVCRGPPVRR